MPELVDTVVKVGVTDEVSGPMRKLMNQTRLMFYAAYFGRRIAVLLTSDDPRQRKRGLRLVSQMEAIRDDYRKD